MVARPSSAEETITCASASEVVRAGLRALQERDAAVERWLREEVAPVCDAMQAEPGAASPPTRSRRRSPRATPRG